MIRKMFARRLSQSTRRATRRFGKFEMLEDRRLLALRIWTGGGANDLWTNPQNWTRTRSVS